MSNRRLWYYRINIFEWTTTELISWCTSWNPDYILTNEFPDINIILTKSNNLYLSIPSTGPQLEHLDVKIISINRIGHTSRNHTDYLYSAKQKAIAFKCNCSGRYWQWESLCRSMYKMLPLATTRMSMCRLSCSCHILRRFSAVCMSVACAETYFCVKQGTYS